MSNLISNEYDQERLTEPLSVLIYLVKSEVLAEKKTIDKKTKQKQTLRSDSGLHTRHFGTQPQQHVAEHANTHLLPDPLKSTTCHTKEPDNKTE